MDTLRTISQTIEGAGVRREDDLDRVRNLEREIVCVDEEIDKRVYVLYYLTEEEVKIIDRKEQIMAKKKIILLTILVTMLTACAQAPAESTTPSPVLTNTFFPTSTIGEISIEHAQVIYYDITGSTESELRKSMDQLRPKDPYDNNRPVDAYTDWYISWNWPGYGTDNCDLTATSVSYEIKLTVPRWKTPTDASHELIAKWEKYTQSVALHEKGHVENIVNNYRDVKTAIESATCSTADAAAQNTLASLRKFDSDYDRETKHGATQGAIFP